MTDLGRPRPRRQGFLEETGPDRSADSLFETLSRTPGATFIDFRIRNPMLFTSLPLRRG